MIIPAGSSQTCFQSIFSYLRRFPKVRAGLLIFRLKYLVFSRNFVKTPYSRAQHVGLNWSGLKNVINSVILLTKGLVWQMVTPIVFSVRISLTQSCQLVKLSEGNATTFKICCLSLSDFFSLLTDCKTCSTFEKDILSSFNNWGWELWFSLRAFNLLIGFFFTRLQHFVQNKRILSRVVLAYCQILTTLYCYDSNRTQSKCFLKAP